MENSSNECAYLPFKYGAADLIADLMAQLADADAVVRQDAAVALGDMGHQAAEAVDFLRQRLLSENVSYHDRACAAWALSQIVEKDDSSVIADLLHVLQTEVASPVADRLRYHCGFALEELAGDDETLEFVRRSRAADPYWQEVDRLISEIPAAGEFR